MRAPKAMQVFSVDMTVAQQPLSKLGSVTCLHVTNATT